MLSRKIFKNCEVEEKLQQEYEALAEAHEALAYDWAKLKKENKELHDYYDDMRKNYNELYDRYEKLYEAHERLSYDWAKLKKENRELNRKSNEPVEEIMTLDDWLKEKEEEKNAEE